MAALWIVVFWLESNHFPSCFLWLLSILLTHLNIILLFELEWSPLKRLIATLEAHVRSEWPLGKTPDSLCSSPINLHCTAHRAEKYPKIKTTSCNLVLSSLYCSNSTLKIVFLTVICCFSTVWFRLRMFSVIWSILDQCVEYCNP